MHKQHYLLSLLLFLIFCCRGLAQIPNTLSETEKIYGLSLFWQEVNYNFVYLDQVDREEWDQMYRSMLDQVTETENDYEYYRLLQRFCAFLQDGHTNVYFPRSVDSLVYNTMFGEYRFFLQNIDNKAIIARVNASKKDEIPVGSEIIEVNGLATTDHLSRNVLPYISSSTEYVLMDDGIRNLLRGLIGTKFDIKIRTPEGEIRSFSLTHSRSEDLEVHPPFENRGWLDFKWLEDDIAYVALNSFGNRIIDTLFVEKLPELYKAKSLILDLRYNGGGSTDIGFEILQYLTEKKLLYGSRTASRNHIPSYKAWGKWVNAEDTVQNSWAKRSYLHYRDLDMYEFEYSPDSNEVTGPKITVPTAVLIGHNTASAAEDFLIYADGLSHFTKIGENTFGSTGQPMLFDLPGGGSARICTKKDTYPDGKEFVGYGVEPDIRVAPTVRDFIENNDPVLDRALAFLKGK